MKYPLLILVLIGLVVTACQDGQQVMTNNPFIGGAEGLSMDFADGAPPDEIYDSGQFPFSVNVVVENVGENTVLAEEAFVRLIGINPSTFNVTPADMHMYLDDNLRSAAKLIDGSSVPGDITTFVIPPDDPPLLYKPNLLGTDEIILRAELCYKYMTKSTTQICIKDQTLDTLNNDKICSVNEMKYPQNWGAPIHISEVREFPQGKNNIGITFKIEHVGTGLFFDKNDFAKGYDLACDDSITNPNENRLWVKVHFGGESDPPQITCPLLKKGSPPYGDIVMFQGQPREITCTIKGDKDGRKIYQGLLSIDLEYTYLNYIEKPVIVRDVSTDDEP
ncbi:MAG: hypothetical protein ABIJ21_07765 [Nanoarchaeota archaeon]